MRDIKITTWAKKRGACGLGIRWALDHCPTGKMSEAWEKLLEHGTEGAPNEYLWWVISKCFDDKTLRLLSVRMVRETPLADGRKVVDLLTDQRSLNALVAAERFANGEISRQELAAARYAAKDARDAARDAQAAAWYAASDAARDAAWAAARYAASDAAWYAARDAAWAAQVKIIAELGNPWRTK